MLRLATIPAARTLYHARCTLKPTTPRAWFSTAPRNLSDHESWHSWNLNTCSKNKLMDKLRELDMSVSGTKPELVRRLERIKSEKRQTISNNKVDIAGSPDKPAQMLKADINVSDQPASALSGDVKDTQGLSTEQVVQVDQKAPLSQANPPAASSSADSRDPIPPAHQPDALPRPSPAVTNTTSSSIAESGIDEFNEDFVKMFDMKLARPKAATTPNPELLPIRARERTPLISFRGNRNLTRRTIEPADRNGEGAVPALEQPRVFAASGTTRLAVDRVAAATTTTAVAASTTTTATTTAVENDDDVPPDEEWMTAFETKVSNRSGRSGVLMQQLKQLDATSVGPAAKRSVPSYDATRAQEREKVQGERVKMEDTVTREDKTVDSVKGNNAVQGGLGRMDNGKMTGELSGLFNQQSPIAQTTHPTYQTPPAITTTPFSSSDNQEYDANSTKIPLRDKVILSGIALGTAAWWAAGGKAGDRKQKTKTQAEA